MQAAKSQTAAKRCTICRAQTDGNYMRIEACRACSVFYRRANNNGTWLKCRTGTDNCVLDRENVWACKKCRYKKIQELFSQQEELAHNVEPCSSTSNTDSECSPSYCPEELGPMVAGPILQRYRTCYNELCRERLFIEFGTLDNLPRNENGVVAALSSFAMGCTHIMKQLYEKTMTFLSSASEDFANLNHDYQMRLFSNFCRFIHSFESCYRSAKYFPDNGKRIFSSFGRFVDIDNLEDAYVDMPESLHKMDVIRYTNECMLKNWDAWRPIVFRLQLSEVEFIAIVAYLVWNFTGKSEPEDLVEIVERNRNAILHELHEYYKYIGLEDYSARLGEIFMFISSINTLVSSYAELFEMFKLLDVIDEEAYLMAKISFTD